MLYNGGYRRPPWGGYSCWLNDQAPQEREVIVVTTTTITWPLYPPFLTSIGDEMALDITDDLGTWDRQEVIDPVLHVHTHTWPAMMETILAIY